MKRLTINRIAGASLQTNRRSYLSMALGIVLAVTMITSICLLTYGALLKEREKVREKVGAASGFLLEAGDVSDDAMLATGMFTHLAHVTNYASVADTDLYIGCYDDAAWTMMNRRFLSGRAPQTDGEIAMEEMALYRLGLEETQVGEQVSIPMADAEGTAMGETRTFTLCGILTNQSENMRMEYYNGLYKGNGYCAFPALLTVPQTQYSGTVFRHLLYQKQPFVSNRAISDYVEAHFGRAYCVLIASNGTLHSANIEIAADKMPTEAVSLILILGLALVLASGIGIASAMESQLARKTEEIGMLRAVGATRRQIRRIFGREAWLLTLVLSPLSVGMGVLAAWGVAKIAPDKITFAPAPVILLPILLFTALMLLISSRLPLRKAAAIAPMQVIKDAATMRKARRFKGKKQFKPAALLAGRQLRLHPTRQLGAAVIVTAMLFFVFCMVISFELVSREDPTAFVLLPQTQDFSDGFSQVRYPDYLSAQSVQELAQLPQVSAVREIRTRHVFSAVDAVGEYIQNSDKRGNAWKTDETYQQSQEAKEIRARLNLDSRQVLLKHNLVICADAGALRRYVAEGTIDISALDAGREVLIYLPETWVNEGNFGMVSREPLARYTAHEVNDQFHPGDSLPLYQLICDGAEAAIAGQNDVANMELHHAEVKIGAVLTGEMDSWYSDGTVITTPKGLQALGFWQGNQERVLLEAAGELDDDAEEMLTQEVSRIAMRGNMQVVNYISYYRQELRET